MSVTYSINIGQITESTSSKTINEALSSIPDNFQKLINPKDVRNALLTNWANSIFKIIEQGQFKYIGIDTGNPNNIDVKNKILLGKRRFSGIEIMNSTLLSSDTDIFFYNTKPDNVNQDKTKITILAGDNPSSFSNSPYIEARNTTNNRVELNLNSFSDLNIKSELGTVSINKIKFPSIEDNQNLIDNKVLKYSGQYPIGKLVWSDLEFSEINIGSEDSTTNLIGNVTLNGFPLEFIEDKLVPNNIGGIPQGFSFPENSYQGQDWPLTEVIRKLLYPSIEPKLELSVINLETGDNLAEIGSTVSISISYSITSYAREETEYIRDYFISDNSSVVVSGMSFSSLPGSVLNMTSSTVKNSFNDVDYTLYVSNNWDHLLSLTYSNIFGFSYSITKKIEYINPFVANFNFNSFNLFGIDAKNGLKELLINGNKNISKLPNNNESVFIGATGSGYLYLAYPNSYGEASKIKDPNGFIVHNSENLSISAFTYSTQQNINPTSPLEYYTNYIIYQTILPCSYNGLGKFEIIF